MSNQAGDNKQHVKRALVGALLRQAGIPARKDVSPDSAARVMDDRPFPLTEMQESYWVGQSDFFELGALSPSGYFEFESVALDVARFERAWQILIERHDMLRAIVLPTGEQQIVRDVPKLHIPTFDLRGRPAEESAHTLADARFRLERGPNTDRWPLFRLEIYQMDHRTLVLLNLSLFIADGLSVHLLLAECSDLYRDPTAHLPDIEFSFKDYVLGVAALRSSSSYKRAERYWLDRLSTLPPPPDLPTRRSPGSLANQAMKRLSGRLPASSWLQVKRRAHRARLTPNAVLCTAFTDVLAAWSRSPLFTINVVAMNRLPIHPHVGRLFGNFSSPILLQVDASLPSQFIERARRLQAQLLTDMEHAEYSGIQVMRSLNRMQRRASAATVPIVFTSVLGGTNLQTGSTPIGTILRPVYGSIRTPQVWIDHQLYEDADGLHYAWDLLAEIFPMGVPEQLFRAWEQILQQLADSDKTWTDEVLELIPPEQIAARALVNATDVSIAPLLLHQMFEQRVNENPSSLAVIDGNRQIVYGDLNQMSSRLSKRLRELEARPNSLVAVVMEKGWEQVVATLAILKAGAAYVPIDPTLPLERLRYLLRVTETRVVLTQPEWIGSIQWPADVTLVVVDDRTDDGLISAGDPLPMPCPSDLAYVIFTSGSTGIPKGVMIDHRGAVNTCLDINRRFDIQPSDRVLALSSLSFDLSVYDIFGTLAAGGAIVLPDADASKDPSHWLACLDRHQVTIWNSVPALLELLLTQLATEQRRLPASIRTVLLSGDWIPVSLPDRLRSVGSNVQVISLGGATEASIWSVVFPVGRVDPSWPSIPYGRPLDNQSLHILDNALSPRPDWVPGSIYIGGIGQAQGYWRDPEMSKRLFITHPRTGERLYRTGDEGRYLPDGNVEFLGRQDFQVKVNGYRIELGEIEAALGQHPSVRATVVGVDGTKGQRRLVAYVVLHPGATIQSTALRNFLIARLPDYMVPTRYQFVPELKRTENGKLDRKALMESDSQRLLLQDNGRATPVEQTGAQNHRMGNESCNDVERRLLVIWESLLDTRPIGIEDNFFDLGGHSIDAVRLLGQIHREFGLRLPASVLLRHGTIQQIAGLLVSRSPQSQRGPLVPIKLGSALTPFFFIHPIGGGVLCYSGLARHLAADQPVFGLQSCGYEDDDTPLNSVEEMAQRYASAIQQQQPHGPFVLGGWSFGGAVACATAHQLLARGEKVSLVVLLDVYPLNTPNAFAPLSDVHLLRTFLDDLAAQSGKPTLGECPEGVHAYSTIDLLIATAREAGIIPPEMSTEQLRRLLAVFRANRMAAHTYVPTPLSAPILALFAEQSAGARLAAPDGGWRSVANGKWSQQIVPGDHYSMLVPPNLAELAARIQDSIDARSLAPS